MACERPRITVVDDDLVLHDIGEVAGAQFPLSDVQPEIVERLRVLRFNLHCSFKRLLSAVSESLFVIGNAEQIVGFRQFGI